MPPADPQISYRLYQGRHVIRVVTLVKRHHRILSFCSDFPEGI